MNLITCEFEYRCDFSAGRRKRGGGGVHENTVRVGKWSTTNWGTSYLVFTEAECFSWLYSVVEKEVREKLVALPRIYAFK